MSYGYNWNENVNTMKTIIDEEIHEQGLTKYEHDVYVFFQERIKEQGHPPASKFDEINRNIMSSVGSYMQYITNKKNNDSIDSHTISEKQQLITSEEIQNMRMEKLNSEYKSKYNEYQDMYHAKRPKEINFEEKLDDDNENIDELLEKEMRKRQQYELQIQESIPKSTQKNKKQVVWHEDVVKSTKVIPIYDSNETIEYETLQSHSNHNKHDPIHNETLNQEGKLLSDTSLPNTALREKKSTPTIPLVSKLKKQQDTHQLWFPISFDKLHSSEYYFVYSIHISPETKKTNMYLSNLLFEWDIETQSFPDKVCFIDKSDLLKEGQIDTHMLNKQNFYNVKKYILLNVTKRYQLCSHIIYDGYAKINDNTIMVLSNSNPTNNDTSNDKIERTFTINDLNCLGCFKNDLNN